MPGPGPQDTKPARHIRTPLQGAGWAMGPCAATVLLRVSSEPLGGRGLENIPEPRRVRGAQSAYQALLRTRLGARTGKETVAGARAPAVAALEPCSAGARTSPPTSRARTRSITNSISDEERSMRSWIEEGAWILRWGENRRGRRIPMKSCTMSCEKTRWQRPTVRLG